MPRTTRCSRYGSQADSPFGIFQLRDAARTIRHRTADIEQQIGDEVRFGLVELDVVPVAAGVGLPVDMLDLIARNVLTVCGELAADPARRTAVHADANALDDLPGDDVQRADLRKDAWFEVLTLHWRSPCLACSVPRR